MHLDEVLILEQKDEVMEQDIRTQIVQITTELYTPRAGDRYRRQH
jgi:hypothetical protein